IMFQTFISRHNSNFFSDKLVLTSVTPASSAPVLQTPKATSSTLYFDSLTVNAGNGGFLHCIQMDTSVNAANQVVSVGADIRSEERFSRNAEIRKTRYMHKMRCLLINRRSLLLALRLLWKPPIFPTRRTFDLIRLKLHRQRYILIV